VHTVDPMVVRSPLGWEPVAPRQTKPWASLAIASVVVAVVLIATMFVTLPYYALAPGNARRVDNLIVAGKTRTYPPKGRVLLTTITLYKVNPLEALTGWLRDDVDVVKERTILPPDTNDQEYRQYNVEEMDDSKQTAIVVALRRLGYQVTERGDGALVERVLAEFPANGRLQPGEVIHQMDGRPVNLVADATAIIAAHHPGESVHLQVSQVDGSNAHELDVPVAADPEQGNKPVLGVFLRTHGRHFDKPFDVDIRSGSIGGPSAGLAFTLGLIDELTPGELTGGRKVAVTGTIEIDGRVGDVGGVAQKTAAVRAAGAEVFLVPAGEYDIAKRKAGRGIVVLKVTTLQEALDALASVGGDLAGLSDVTTGQFAAGTGTGTGTGG
jgi:PDZ domain-containing protein